MVFEIVNWILFNSFEMTAVNKQVLSSCSDELSEKKTFKSSYDSLIQIRDLAYQENQHNTNDLINLAGAFFDLEKFADAVDIYAREFFLDSLSEEHLFCFVNVLCKKVSTLPRKKIHCGAEVCCMCQGILLEPLTLPCGHTHCRNCLLKRNDSNIHCIKCTIRFAVEEVSKTKSNVTISNILEKIWPKEIKVAKLRISGSSFCKEKDYENGILKYREAEKLDPHDHLVQSSLCSALLATGREKEALEVAKKIINLIPTLFIGYFYEGAALLKLGLHEEALVAYLHCLILDNSNLSVRKTIQKLVYGIIKEQHTEIFLNEEELSDCSHSHYKSQTDTARHQTCLPLSSLCKEVLKSQRWSKADSRLWRKEKDKLERILDMFEKQLEHMKDLCESPIVRSAQNEDIDETDFECSLCIRVFWQPVTTPCGHMFCRACLDRSLDHKPQCPLCKDSLKEYLAERRSATTEFMEELIPRFLPDAHRDRKRCYEEEMEELSHAGKDSNHGVPLFVCTMAYPGIPCPLHIFEPRYRLMTRQCMESGTREFGMCTLQDDQADGIARFGTMLTIRNITYYPDGRSIVDAVGAKRFRVLQTGMRDGYHIGSVKFIYDSPVSDSELQELQCLHDAVYCEVSEWFALVPQHTRSVVLDHFGPLPSPEEFYFLSTNGPRWVWWTLAILPIGVKVQIQILGMNSLKERLKSLRSALRLVCRFGPPGVSR